MADRMSSLIFVTRCESCVHPATFMYFCRELSPCLRELGDGPVNTREQFLDEIVSIRVLSHQLLNYALYILYIARATRLAVVDFWGNWRLDVGWKLEVSCLYLGLVSGLCECLLLFT